MGNRFRDKPGPRTMLPYRTMYLPFLLLLGSLAPFSSRAQFTGAGPVWYSPPAAGYGAGSEAAYGGYLGSDPSGGPRFGYDSSYQDWGWGAAKVPAFGSAGYPVEAASGPLREPVPVSRTPRSSTAVTGSPDSMWSAAREPGFRFRGDNERSDASWQESPYAPGYRFRPLTQTETERSSSIKRWRPVAPNADRRGAARPDRIPYQSNDWSGAYFGGWP